MNNKLLVGLLFLVTGCGVASVKDESSVSEASAMKDVKATNCEIFVDKMRLSSSSHGFLGTTPYVKIVRDRLDGDVVKVGFFGSHSYKGLDGQSQGGQWKEYPGYAFLGASDYFEVKEDLYNQFTLAVDFSMNHVYEGAFFVETTKATRYWANTAESGNFRIDYDSISALKGNAWSLSAVAYEHMQDIGKVPATADMLPYYNPQHCR